MKKSLLIASVASIIDQFNMDNIKLLQKIGFEVTVTANFKFGNTSSIERTVIFKKNLISMGVKIYNVFLKRNVFSFQNIKIYKQIKKIIEKNEFRLIHCHSPIGGVITRFASRKLSVNAVKIIYTAHGFHFFRGAPLLNWLLYYPVERWLARYTDVLITINHEDYFQAKKFKLRNGGKVYYVPGIGVDTSKYENTVVDKTKKRKALGVPEKSIIILSVGELTKRKNHETIIRAITKIKRDNLYYIICGRGKLEEYLKKLCRRLGISDKVIFLGFRTDIAEICKVVDIFAFPSLQEGLPVALMEAMAARLPVVCSKIRGNTDLLENGKGGELLMPRDVNGFTKVVEKLIDDEFLRERMGTHNAKVAKLFDITVVNEKMEKIYNE
ncbi:MAG: glycosyltransferase [Clostridiales bacterium]